MSSVDVELTTVAELREELLKFDQYKDGRFSIRHADRTKSRWRSWIYKPESDAKIVSRGGKSTTLASDEDMLLYMESKIYFVYAHPKANSASVDGQDDSLDATSDESLIGGVYVDIDS
ncbi:hypothetical protein IWW39_001939 [Coemansia spiralis]|uniref:Uncharacterized protein n=1 Tax=Coemansia spiralis TaxID=417178 RepID=A0A9W8L5S3_9FUNG|nr:hypothetical protein IWW39_001939 [Coemansia spiralis]